MDNESRTYLENIKKLCDNGCYSIKDISSIIKNILSQDDFLKDEERKYFDRNKQPKKVRQVKQDSKQK